MTPDTVTKAKSADEDKPSTSSGRDPGFAATAIGVLGFIFALGAGFFIGQWIQRPPSKPVTIVEGDRYRVQLRGDEPTQGPPDALVTIVEFADFQCPFCGKASEPIAEIVEDYDGDVRVIFKHYPLPFHPRAPQAARASWAAHQQGKFWEVHDWLYEHKAELDGLQSYVADLGMDAAKFAADSVSTEAVAAVDGDFLAGGTVGVGATPAFFVNGHPYTGAKDESAWRQIVDAELAEARGLLDNGVARADVYAALMKDALTKVDGKPGEAPQEDP